MDNNQDYSKLIAQILRKKFPFEQAKLNMYLDNDIYNRIPNLIFRLQETSKYSEIKACIESFHGILQWTLYKYEFSRKDNYVIAPLILYEIEKNYINKAQNTNEREVIPEDDYESICKNAIKDIPKLAEHIQIYFNIKD